MKAVRFHESGAPDVLRYEDVERAVPGSGQVRIRVAATSFDGIDANVRAGTMRGPMPKLGRAGVPVEFHLHRGVPHEFRSTIARRAVADRVRVLKSI